MWRLAIVLGTNFSSPDPAKVVGLRWADGGFDNAAAGVERWAVYGLAPACLQPARPTSLELAQEWWLPGTVARRGARVQRQGDLHAGAGDESVGVGVMAMGVDAVGVAKAGPVATTLSDQLGLVVAPADEDGHVRLIWADGKPSGGGWLSDGLPNSGVDPRELRPCYKDEDSVLAATCQWCRPGAFVRHEGRDGQLCVVSTVAKPGENDDGDEPYAEVTWTTGLAHVQEALQARLGLRPVRYPAPRGCSASLFILATYVCY